MRWSRGAWTHASGRTIPLRSSLVLRKLFPSAAGQTVATGTQIHIADQFPAVQIAAQRVSRNWRMKQSPAR